MQGFAPDMLIDRSACYFAELNYIHPFRESSGRSTREFMRQLYALNGYAVNWAAASTEELLGAAEASVYDTARLKSVLSVCVLKSEA